MKNKTRNQILRKVREEEYKTVFPIDERLKIENDFSIINHRIFEISEIAFNALWKIIKAESEEILSSYLTQNEAEIRIILIDHFYDMSKYYLMGRIFYAAKYNIDKDIDRYIEFDQEYKVFNYKNDGEKKLAAEIVQLMLTGPRIINQLRNKQTENFQEEILYLENRQGTYDKRIFKRAYKIQKENQGKKPKITDEQAIIKANEQLLLYPQEKLADNNGMPTEFLFHIKKTYSNYHKKILREKDK